MNRARLAKLRREQHGTPEYRAWLHGQPCATCRSACGPIHLSHVRSRGARGKARQQIPQCAACHREWHEGRLTFCRRRGLAVDDLLAAAEAYAAAFERLGGSVV